MSDRTSVGDSNQKGRYDSSWIAIAICITYIYICKYIYIYHLLFLLLLYTVISCLYTVISSLVCMYLIFYYSYISLSINLFGEL